MINEAVRYGSEGNGEEIYDLGEISIHDHKTNKIVKVKTPDIISVVNDARLYLQKKYPYLHLFLVSYKIMYIPVWPSQICPTMCVDGNNNLWINMSYVYNECNMDKNRVFGILFHEMFHIFLEHLIRFNTMFPDSVKALMSKDVFDVANKKANIAMDYEINASMVADEIVSEDFWKIMNGLYKKEYMGRTWEDIYQNYGDKEYREWLERNGETVSEKEMKILDAIEKATSVLKDPTATEEDKAKANRELQKTIDEILGRDRDEDIQDILEKVKDSRMGDIGEIADRMQDVINDLYKSPSQMTEEQFDKLLEDIDNMAREMAKNASKIAKTFDKSEGDTMTDIKRMRNTMRKSITKMREQKMTKNDKKDIVDKIKDCLEDVMTSEINKEKNAKKRKERDEKKEKERKEAIKAAHPLRKIIKVFNNLIKLGEEPYDLVCPTSHTIMGDIVDILDKLTEKQLSEITKSDIEDLKSPLSKLKESLFNDIKALLDNKTILHKTEDELYDILDGVFKDVEKSLFVHLLDTSLTDSEKESALKLAANRLRMIGKILKTQKAWRASDEFKEGFREMRNDLMSLFKKDKKAVLKRLFDMGLINSVIVEATFDKRSKALFKEMVDEGIIS
jgi:hypothetical protein